jgi:hypothetical protein
MKKAIFSVSEKSLFQGAIKKQFFFFRKIAFSGRHEKGYFFRFRISRFLRAP